MSFKQNKARGEKREKKKMKIKGPILSSSELSDHYCGRSQERSGNQTVKPYHRKAMMKLIARKMVFVRKTKSGNKEIIFKNGRKIVVTGDMKKAITFEN